MKNLDPRHCSITGLTAMVLFVIGALAAHVPAAATTYTYTGLPFIETSPVSAWPLSPVIGDHIDISFTYAGDLQPGASYGWNSSLTALTVSCGDVMLTMDSSPPLVWRIISVGPDGLPLYWEIGSQGNPPGWYLGSHATAGGGGGLVEDNDEIVWESPSG